MDNTSWKQRLSQFTQRRVALLRDDSAKYGRSILVAPAKNIKAEQVNELLHYTGGHLFVAIGPSRAEAFMLPSMRRPGVNPARVLHTPDDVNPLAACVSVEAREGVTTGISSADRAQTIAILGEDEPNPRKLVKPGHIFPVVVRPGGTLVKHALPEGALDLMSIANAGEAALFVDLLGKTGDYLKTREQDLLSTEHRIPVFLLSELVRYRLENEKLVQRVASAKLPTTLAGELTAHLFRSTLHGGEHLALVKGEISDLKPTLVRVQAESTFSDVFAAKNNRSRARLSAALRAIGERETGVLVYLRKTYSGGMVDELRQLEEDHVPRPAAIMREYGLGAQIIQHLGIRKIELLTGSEKNLVGLRPFGIEIVSQSLLKRPPRGRSTSVKNPTVANAL